MSPSAADRKPKSRLIGVVVVLTLALVGTALFVGRAWRKEARAWELAAKTRLFDLQLLENPQIDAARLAVLEKLLEDIAQMSRPDAEARRTRLYESLAATLRGQLHAPGFSDDDRARFDADLADFQSRFAKHDGRIASFIEQLKSERDARLGGWDVLFDLQAPFNSEVTEVFATDRVATDDGRSLKRVAEEDTHYAPTKIDCPPGELELHVEFDRLWTRASLIGASLNYSTGRRYDFLIAVPSFDYRDTTPGELAQLPPFDEVIGKRTDNRLHVYILRDGLPLRKEAATISADRLHLTARRRGARLELTVNGKETYAFEDPFPLPANERGVFAVYWPPLVHVERLSARRLRVPQETRPLERADALYAHGTYGDALEAYRAQNTLEAAYKAALCEFALGRTEEFLQEVTRIAAQPLLAARGNPDDRWRLSAACRLLQHRVEAREWDHVRKLLRTIDAAYNREQIDLVIPAVQHELILQYFRRPEANRSPLLADRTTSLDELALAARIQELFGEDPAARHIAEWRVADAYRAKQRTGEALAIFHELLEENDWTPFERMAVLADVADMLTRNGQPEAAVKELNTWLLDRERDYRAIYLPLLVFRAATRVATGEKEKAKADLDYFLQHVDVRQVDYSHFAHACGLRGMLHSEEGDTDAAMKVWRQGLRRNWHEGYLEPQEMAALRGFESTFAYNSIVFDGILGSWTGEVTQDEAYRNMWNLYPGSGVFSTSFRKLVEVSFEPEFIREVMKESSNSRLGKEQGRESLLQHTTPDNALSFVVAFVRISCLADVEQTPEVEEILERSCRFLVESYFNGTFDETDLKDLLNVWRGRFSESAFLRLARKAKEHNPELAASAAFAFGCKYAREGDREVARYLFEYALTIDEIHPVVDKLSRSRLERLASLDGKPTP